MKDIKALFYCILGSFCTMFLLCLIGIIGYQAPMNVYVKGTLRDTRGKLVENAAVVLTNDKMSVGKHGARGCLSVVFMPLHSEYKETGIYEISYNNPEPRQTCILFVMAPGYDTYSREIPNHVSARDRHTIDIVMSESK